MSISGGDGGGLRPDSRRLVVAGRGRSGDAGRGATLGGVIAGKTYFWGRRRAILLSCGRRVPDIDSSC